MKVLKTTGAKELFQPKKLIQSLELAGATPDTARLVSTKVKKGSRALIPSQKLFQTARTLLLKHEPAAGLRYGLAHALIDLPGAGITFSDFVTQLLSMHGYDTRPAGRLRGQCVTHDIDGVARRDGSTWFLTCITTTHHQPAPLEDGLIAQARTQDLRHSLEFWQDQKEGWVFCNGKADPRLSVYAHCSNLKLSAWNTPGRNSIQSLIERAHYYPITILPGLNKNHLKKLIAGGFFGTADILQRRSAFGRLGLPVGVKKKMIAWAELLNT